MNKVIKKVNLDECVYAEWDGYRIILTTEIGYYDDTRNQIGLGNHALNALSKYQDDITDYITKTSMEQIMKDFGCEIQNEIRNDENLLVNIA